jgi:tripartite-type tricarboxylate transporter receptor subunit TctC
MTAPDVLARCAALGLEPMTANPDEFSNSLNTAIETWGPILRRMNVTLQ